MTDRDAVIVALGDSVRLADEHGEVLVVGRAEIVARPTTFGEDTAALVIRLDESEVKP